MKAAERGLYWQLRGGESTVLFWLVHGVSFPHQLLLAH